MCKTRSDSVYLYPRLAVERYSGGCCKSWEWYMLIRSAGLMDFGHKEAWNIVLVSVQFQVQMGAGLATNPA